MSVASPPPGAGADGRTSIRRRVLAMLVALGSLFAGGVFFTFLGYGRIQEDHRQVRDAMLPTMLLSSRLAEASATLSERLPRSVDAAIADTKLADQLELRAREVAALSKELLGSGGVEKVAATILQGVTQLSADFHALRDLDNRARRGLASSSEALERSLRLLESLSIDEADALLMRSNRTRALVEGRRRSAALRSLSAEVEHRRRLDSLSELSLKLLSASSQLEQAKLATRPEDLAGIRERYFVDLRVAVRLLGLVGDRGVRRQLSEPLELLLSLDAPESEALALWGRRLAAARAASRRLSEIRGTLVALLERTDAIATAARRTLELGQRQGAERLRWYGALAGALSVLFLLLTLAAMVFVNRSILGPIDALTAATVALSRGRLETEVPRSDMLEIEQMALALESFRNNALDLEVQERLARDRAEALVTSNAELRRFVYVASHDLRSPIRGVGQLLGFLEEDLAPVWAAHPDSAQDLAKARARLQRLQRMLEDLLAYARAARFEGRAEPLDIARVARECMEIVTPSPEYQLKLEGEALSFSTAVAPFTQVLRNLLDNALKHHDRDHGTVIVRWHREAPWLVVEVEDDGPGIPAPLQSRIFELFQTGSPRDVKEASGMGLAILEKVVRSTGGSIGVVSDAPVRRGAVFRFSWPLDWNSVARRRQATGLDAETA